MGKSKQTVPTSMKLIKDGKDSPKYFAKYYLTTDKF